MRLASNRCLPAVLVVLSGVIGWDPAGCRAQPPFNDGPVAREERQQLARRGQEVQKSREQRRTLEAGAREPATRPAGGVVEPAQVQLPRSPIVARPAGQSARNPPPPKAPQAPIPDLKVQPRSVPPGRPAIVERSSPPPQSRQREPAQQPTAGINKAAPRVRPNPPEPAPRTRDAAVQAREESQRNARGLEMKAPKEPEPPAKEEPAAGEKGAAKPVKKGQERDERGKPSPPKDPREP